MLHGQLWIGKGDVVLSAKGLGTKQRNEHRQVNQTLTSSYKPFSSLLYLCHSHLGTRQMCCSILLATLRLSRGLGRVANFIQFTPPYERSL